MGSDYPKKTIDVWWEEDLEGVMEDVWRTGIFIHNQETHVGVTLDFDREPIDESFIDDMFSTKKEALEHANRLQDWYSEHQLPIHVYTMDEKLQRIIEPS